jgi:O-antigen ligase
MSVLAVYPPISKLINLSDILFIFVIIFACPDINSNSIGVGKYESNNKFIKTIAISVFICYNFYVLIDVYGEKTLPKTHKTIFGTTAKSNFILNMKTSSVERLTQIGLIAVILLPILSGAIVSIIDKHYVILAIGTYISGFTAILFFLISALRGDIELKRNISFWFIVALAVLAFASYYAAFMNPYEGLRNSMHELLTPLLGEYGRYEGLLVLLCYFGIFLLASCVTEKKTLTKITIALIIAAAVSIIFSILQHIPGLGFPNAYKDLPTYAYENVYISSGITDNPIFYGGFVTLMFAVFGGLAVFGKRYRILFGVLALAALTTGLFTSSITPIIGCTAAAVALVVLSFVRAKIHEADTSKTGRVKRKIKSVPDGAFGYDLRLMAIVLLLAAVVIFLIVLLTQGIWIRDMYIARLDGALRKFIVGSTISDERSLYENAWGAAFEMIKKFPIFGVGPDSFAAYQNFTVMTYDTAYNEYLFTAATRGIASALVYIGLLVTTFATLIKRIKNPYAPILITAIFAYVCQAMMNSSAVTVAPFFWLALGLSFSPVLAVPRTSNK